MLARLDNLSAEVRMDRHNDDRRDYDHRDYDHRDENHDQGRPY